MANKQIVIKDAKIALTGPKGPTGPTGPTGPVGPTGPTNDSKLKDGMGNALFAVNQSGDSNILIIDCGDSTNCRYTIPTSLK